MEIFPIQDHKFIIRLKEKYTKKKFVNYFKPQKGSYSESFVLSIYDCLIINSIDIKNEYDTYYSDEYDSIEEFLFLRYFVTEDVIRKICDDLQKKEFIGIFQDFRFNFKDENIISGAIYKFLNQLEK